MPGKFNVNLNVTPPKTLGDKFKTDHCEKIIHILKSSSTIPEAFEKAMKIKKAYFSTPVKIERDHMYPICCLYRAENKGMFPTSFEQIKTFLKNQYAANKKLPKYDGLDDSEKYFKEFMDLTQTEKVSGKLFDHQKYDLVKLRSLRLISKYCNIEISPSEKLFSTNTIDSLNENTFYNIYDYLDKEADKTAIRRVDKKFYHLSNLIPRSLTVNFDSDNTKSQSFLTFLKSSKCSISTLKLAGKMATKTNRFLAISEILKTRPQIKILEINYSMNSEEFAFFLDFVKSDRFKGNIHSILTVIENMPPEQFDKFLNFVTSGRFKGNLDLSKAKWLSIIDEGFEETRIIRLFKALEAYAPTATTKISITGRLTVDADMSTGNFNSLLDFIKSDIFQATIKWSGNTNFTAARRAQIDQAYKEQALIASAKQ